MRRIERLMSLALMGFALSEMSFAGNADRMPEEGILNASMEHLPSNSILRLKKPLVIPANQRFVQLDDDSADLECRYRQIIQVSPEGRFRRLAAGTELRTGAVSFDHGAALIGLGSSVPGATLRLAEMYGNCTVGSLNNGNFQLITTPPVEIRIRERDDDSWMSKAINARLGKRVSNTMEPDDDSWINAYHLRSLPVGTELKFRENLILKANTNRTYPSWPGYLVCHDTFPQDRQLSTEMVFTVTAVEVSNESVCSGHDTHPGDSRPVVKLKVRSAGGFKTQIVASPSTIRIFRSRFDIKIPSTEQPLEMPTEQPAGMKSAKLHFNAKEAICDSYPPPLGGPALTLSDVQQNLDRVVGYTKWRIKYKICYTSGDCTPVDENVVDFSLSDYIGDPDPESAPEKYEAYMWLEDGRENERILVNSDFLSVYDRNAFYNKADPNNLFPGLVRFRQTWDGFPVTNLKGYISRNQISAADCRYVTGEDRLGNGVYLEIRKEQISKLKF
jgi:hypothetical protein